jgi:hypothetical protein
MRLRPPPDCTVPLPRHRPCRCACVHAADELGSQYTTRSASTAASHPASLRCSAAPSPAELRPDVSTKALTFATLKRSIMTGD